MGISIKLFDPLFSETFGELEDGAFFVSTDRLEDKERKDVPLYVKCEEAGEGCAMNLQGFWPSFQPIMSQFEPADGVVQVMLGLSLDFGELMGASEATIA